MTRLHIFSWSNNRRQLMHLCPAVPTAAKKTDHTTIVKSASSIIIRALFPLSSSKHFPNLALTRFWTICPTFVLPVKETNGILLSSTNRIITYVNNFLNLSYPLCKNFFHLQWYKSTKQIQFWSQCFPNQYTTLLWTIELLVRKCHKEFQAKVS